MHSGPEKSGPVRMYSLDKCTHVGVVRVSLTEKQSNECVLQKLGLQFNVYILERLNRENCNGPTSDTRSHVVRNSTCLEKDIIEGHWDLEHVENQR